jgi:ribose 5-phosphate isomerase B
MKIAIGSDGKAHLTATIIEEVKARGHEVTLFGALSDDPALWPDVASRVAREVSSGKCQEGILFCWTGTGVTLAANKIYGIRAALCQDAETARGARLWNDANILAMSLRTTSEAVGKEILQAWFSTAPSQTAEDRACFEAVKQLEKPG